MLELIVCNTSQGGFSQHNPRLSVSPTLSEQYQAHPYSLQPRLIICPQTKGVQGKGTRVDVIAPLRRIVGSQGVGVFRPSPRRVGVVSLPT